MKIQHTIIIGAVIIAMGIIFISTKGQGDVKETKNIEIKQQPKVLDEIQPHPLPVELPVSAQLPIEKQNEVKNNFRPSQFFGDFTGDCIKTGSCGENTVIYALSPSKEKMIEMQFEERYFGDKESSSKALTLTTYTTKSFPGGVGFEVPLYPIGNYQEGDIIDYKNGYTIVVKEMTNTCRTLELSWDTQKRELEVCEGGGLKNIFEI